MLRLGTAARLAAGLCPIALGLALTGVAHATPAAMTAPKTATPGTAPQADGPATPSAAVQDLRYRVWHSVYGDIGTYSNRIERNGDETTVLTEAHFRVALLGIELHREDSERTERWQGNRLVYFHGLTQKNGNSIELAGEARGDNFVITSPSGVVTAPAMVRPANPWSANFLATQTMMLVDTGEVVPVHVSEGVERIVKISGASVPVHEYQVEGKETYKVWLDQHNVPVMFSVDDDSGLVTFTLGSIGSAAPERGRRGP
jgi:hypothetical protein